VKLKISANFDFGKLNNDLDNLTKKYTSSYSSESAKASKAKIDKGLEPLKDSTKEIRKINGVSGTKPLKASGRLYNSIRNDKGKLKMLKYGFYHDEGFTPKYKPLVVNGKIAKFKNKPKFVKNVSGKGGSVVSVPARKFITTTVKNKKEIDKKFVDDVNKSMKK
tara:strand:+ start:688 stop:1179 length:492 start_codon:yes stop_codon:yes gene_type:complete